MWSAGYPPSMQAHLRAVLLWAAIAALYGGVIVWSLTVDFSDPLSWLLRVCGLAGMLSISLAALMTPFLAQVRALFGESFLRVHHRFAALGILLATLHPVLLAWQTLDPTVFLPVFATPYLFFALGGRAALILMYIGLAAIFLRRRLPQTVWRPLHALMYLVLLLGIVHGNLIGTDFSSPVILVLFNGLFVAVLGAFVLKRWQRRRRKAKPGGAKKG
jgi:DMSO/TMAO reductase YedYZ heme-binding membrane subunit